MKRIHKMAIVLLAGIPLLPTTVKADDMIVRYTDNTGRLTKTVTDHTQIRKVQDALTASIGTGSFKTLIAEETASTDTETRHLLRRSPDYEEEEPEGFKVFFAVEEEEAPEGMIYEPWKVYVCKGDGAYGSEYYNYSYYPDQEILDQGYAWGCYVPEGEYTIILCSEVFKIKGDSQREYYTALYVVKENVSITGDTTITFRQSDAKNCITASCLLPDGSDAGTPWITGEDGYPVMREDVMMSAVRSIVNINGDYSLNLGNFSQGDLDCVFINDISANWVYAISMTVVDDEGAYVNCVTHPGPIDSDLHVTNDPNGYVRHVVRFNPEMPGVNPDARGFGVMTDVAWKGVSWINGYKCVKYNGLGISDPLPVYINATPSDHHSPYAFDLVVAPIVANDVSEITFADENGNLVSYYEFQLLSGPGLFQEADDKLVCMDWAGYSNEEYPEELFLLPYDEFSFTPGEDTAFFTYAPVSTIAIDNFRNEAFARFGISCSFNYPCIATGWLPYSLTASYNGEIIAEEIADAEFDWYKWSMEDQKYTAPGVFDISIKSPWKAEDPGAMVSQTLRIDTQNADFLPPQMVRWQLRDNSGNLTDKATLATRLLLMSQENSEDDYSLHLSCPELPDYEFNCGNYKEVRYDDWGIVSYRRVYEISLEDFPGTRGESYSLTFEMTDASGNSSVQTIGHAFEWSGNSGVGEIRKDSEEICVSGGILTAPADAVIFTADGRQVSRTSLSSGLYIVKTAEKTVKVIVP